MLVGASCCIEKVTLAVTDVAGNTNEFEATKWDYGSSPLLAWWVWLIIGKFYSKFLILFCSVWVRLYDMNGLIQTSRKHFSMLQLWVVFWLLLLWFWWLSVVAARRMVKGAAVTAVAGIQLTQMKTENI